MTIEVLVDAEDLKIEKQALCKIREMFLAENKEMEAIVIITAIKRIDSILENLNV